MKAKEMEGLIKRLEGRAMAVAYADSEMAAAYRAGSHTKATVWQTERGQRFQEVTELWTQIHAGLTEGVEP